MDLREFRNKPIARWTEGDPSLLIEQVMKGDLNLAERELIASIIRGNPPKRERGPKIRSLKPVVAGLVRFWRRDVDGWTEEEAIIQAIRDRLKVSRTSARNYLAQIDTPVTIAQAKQKMVFEHELGQRLALLGGSEPEYIQLVNQLREGDLKGIFKK